MADSPGVTVLKFLLEQGGASANFLSWKTGLDYDQVMRVLTRKREQGWVRRFTFDRTIKIWELTSLGRQEVPPLLKRERADA